LAVPSELEVATSAPSGENDADVTTLPCPFRTATRVPVEGSQMRAVRSSHALTSRDPSREKASDPIAPP
jgi:hypothetical protein